MAAHSSKLAGEIPFCNDLNYGKTERLPREAELSLLRRFTDLDQLNVRSFVEDIERFLDLLKNLDNIRNLWLGCDIPQPLVDRLSEHCAALQSLTIQSGRDFSFVPVFRLKNLISLTVAFSIDTQTIKKAFEELQFLSRFKFRFNKSVCTIEVDHHPKQFKVSAKRTTVPDLDSAVLFIIEKAKESN